MKILIFSDFMLILHQKTANFRNFASKNSTKSKKIKIFKKTLYRFVKHHIKSLWSKFQPIWARIVTPDTI